MKKITIVTDQQYEIELVKRAPIKLLMTVREPDRHKAEVILNEWELQELIAALKVILHE